MNIRNSHRKRGLAGLTSWLKKYHLSVTLVVGALVVATGFIIALNSVQFADNTPAAVKIKPKPEIFYSPLTGEKVASAEARAAAVTGVMIENSPESRPQSGLKNAGIVYEAVAEGGITRFLALYQGEKPEKIGPVRSLRLYYLGWAAPYQASIVHVGGSANALTEVRSGRYRDIDEYSNASTFWRATDRYAPHNAYTSGERLDATNNSKGYSQSSFTGFERQDGKASEEPTATAIDVNFSGALFATHYSYDKTTNTYARSLAGAPHQDRESGQIAPSVVVAIEVSAQRRPGSLEGYEDLTTTGSGKTYVFQNGTAVEATWQRTDFSSELKLVDAEGKNLKLNRGQTWIAAITPGRGSVAWR